MSASATQTGTVQPIALCERAVRLAEAKLGSRAILKSEAMTALTAISHLFCRQALCEATARVAIVNGFSCGSIATENAIRAAIARALPGLNPSYASTIYQSLKRALDEEFQVHKYDAVRLAGFGVFRRTGGPPFEYQLTFDLPLQEYLKATLPVPH